MKKRLENLKRSAFSRSAMKKKMSFFHEFSMVYVEDVVEIPDSYSGEAVVTRYQSSEGPFPRSKSCFLPVSDTAKLKSYQWVQDVDPAAETKDDYFIKKRSRFPVLKF